MKSKSFELPKNSAEKAKQKTYDFVNFYKSASEVNVIARRKSDDGSCKENIVSNKLHTPKRVAHNKIKRPQNNSVDVSKINIDGDSLTFDANSSVLDSSKVTSTPNVVKKGVKSIIKNKSLMETPVEDSNASVSNKSKKRNKSVSFMLDEAEGVAIKRTKSEEIVSEPEKSHKTVAKRKKAKNSKKKMQDENENEQGVNNTVIENDPTDNATTSINNNNKKETSSDPNETTEKPEKKNRKKFKKPKPDTVESENPVAKNEGEESKIKKIKKKKRHITSTTPTVSDPENITAEGEPAQKASKKDVKPDKIAHDLENLNIGDNPHTLTNLLDEMTVADKNKKKKNKQKHKEKKQKKEGEGREKKKGKDKTQKIDKSNETNGASIQSTNTEGEVTEEKEKVKWVKRKWNKDKKGGASLDKHLTSVIIENLPLKIMFTYKKLLAEHFEKYGLIKQVGVAEMYPKEDPKPVFSTTINFYSEDSAEKALEEDNALLEGVRIRVLRPLAPTLTTLVVRSYAELSEQALSSVFSAAGRIRSIRQLVKGKRAPATAFIEFDGPQSVERAIQMAEDARISGKKIHVAKFEIRATNKKEQNKTDENNQNSEDSN